jgi:hypothetical protein
MFSVKFKSFITMESEDLRGTKKYIENAEFLVPGIGDVKVSAPLPPELREQIIAHYQDKLKEKIKGVIKI